MLLHSFRDGTLVPNQLLPTLAWALHYPITTDPTLNCVAWNKGLLVNMKCKPTTPLQLAYICEAR